MMITGAVAESKSSSRRAFYADPARLAVPAAVGLEGRTVAEVAAAWRFEG